MGGGLEYLEIFKNPLERWALAAKWVGAMTNEIFRIFYFFRNFQGQFLKKEKGCADGGAVVLTGDPKLGLSTEG